MRSILFLLLLVFTGFAVAQTDYFYSVTHARDGVRKVFAFAANSNGFRQLPDSPYSMEYSPTDGNLVWCGVVAIDDPGPFLYCSRPDPDQIYGYRRLVDGHLELLPGFPITFPRQPGTAGLEIKSLVKHPTRPILYQVNLVNGQISVHHIQVDGGLNEIKGSPFRLSPGLLNLVGFAIPQAGDIAFTNNYLDSIGSVRLDPETGAPDDFRFEANVPGRAAGMVLSDDGRFLYACRPSNNAVFGFAVDGRELTPLPGSPFQVPFTPSWPATHGRFLAVGGRQRMLGLMLIAEDGSLSWAPGSPMVVSSLGNYYASFSPGGDRAFFAGNGENHVFEVAGDGALIGVSGSPSPHYYHSYGADSSTEFIGDPFSLRFEPLPLVGDTRVHVRGDANAPFYLDRNGDCLGPFVTDDAGEAVVDLSISNDNLLRIVAYCDESVSADVLTTIPTLSPWGLGLFCTALVLAGLIFSHTRRFS